MAKKNKKSKNKRNKSKGLSFKQWILVLAAIATLIVFLPTTILLTIGMLPTLVAFIVDRQPGRNKTFTIGVMNFTGCFPYVLEVWLNSNSLDVSFLLISQPKTIIVMYAAAGLGYIIDWAVTYIVSAILVQRSEVRLKKIEKEKKSLEERWGSEVNGLQTLDERGFPVDLGSQQK